MKDTQKYDNTVINNLIKSTLYEINIWTNTIQNKNEEDTLLELYDFLNIFRNSLIDSYRKK